MNVKKKKLLFLFHKFQLRLSAIGNENKMRPVYVHRVPTDADTVC